MVIGAFLFKKLNPNLVALIKELDTRWAKAKNAESLEIQEVSTDSVKIGIWSAQAENAIAQLKFKGIIDAFISGKKELSFDAENGVLSYSNVQSSELKSEATKVVEKTIYKEKELTLGNVLAFIAQTNQDDAKALQSALTNRKKELKED